MRSFAFLPALVPLLFAGSAERSPASQDPIEDPGGRLEWVGPKVHHAGTAVIGQLVVHTARFINGGDADLILASIRPTCKCMSIVVTVDYDVTGQHLFEPGMRLPPGGLVEIGMTIDTTGKSGELHTRVEIEHSGNEHPDYTRVVMDLVEPFTFEPDAFTAGSLRPSDVRQGTLEVSNAFGQPFALELLENKYAEHIDVAAEPIEPDPGGRAPRWKVAFEVRGSLPYRRSARYPVMFVARLAAPPEFATAGTAQTTEFKIRALVVAEPTAWISWSPHEVNFGRLWAGRTYEQTVAIQDNDDDFVLALSAADIAIEDATGGPFPWREQLELSVASAPDDPVTYVKMTASGFPKIMKQPFDAVLVVTTRHPEVPTLRIPFSGQHR